MKLVVLILDDSVSQFQICENTEDSIKNFSRVITGHHFDETRNKAVIQVFNLSPVEEIEFSPKKVKHGKEIITRFELSTR